MSRPIQNLQNPFFTIVFSVLLFGSQGVLAGIGTSLMQTAPILPAGSMEAKLQADFVINNGQGFNLSPHLSVGLVEHYLELDSWVATGTTDFQLGTLGKYNILPDLEGQVALSILAGASYIRDESTSSILTSFGFVASKKTQFSFAEATPYAALQVEAMINNANSTSPISLALGSKWQLPDMKWIFYSELGINLHQSLWVVSAGVGHPF